MLPRLNYIFLNLRFAFVLEVTWFGWTQMNYLVEFFHPRAVLDLKPNFTALVDVETRGTIVTPRAEKTCGADFVARVFSPRYGINEDPAMASVHCFFAPYWGAKLNKDKVRGTKCRTKVER